MLQQFWGGLVGGVIGAFLYLIFDSIFLRLDLFGSIMLLILYYFLGGYIGVIVVVYIYI